MGNFFLFNFYFHSEVISKVAQIAATHNSEDSTLIKL